MMAEYNQQITAVLDTLVAQIYGHLEYPFNITESYHDATTLVMSVEVCAMHGLLVSNTRICEDIQTKLASRLADQNVTSVMLCFEELGGGDSYDEIDNVFVLGKGARVLTAVEVTFNETVS